MSIIIVLTLLIIIPISAKAVQDDTDRFIESEHIFIVLDAYSLNDTLLVDIGFKVNDVWNIVTEENITIFRNESDNQSGRFFGYTDYGNAFYIVYKILDDDNAKLSFMVWHDNTKTRLVEQATIQNLFN